jgi:hypothetical protein
MKFWIGQESAQLSKIMATDNIVKLHKPSIGCGSTNSIMKIIVSLVESGHSVCIIRNIESISKQYKTIFDHYPPSLLKIFTIKDILHHHSFRGYQFVATFLLDASYLKAQVEQELLDHILPRTKILFKEVNGVYPYEIYD